MKERLIILSDIEMGKNDITDDFSDDAVFEQLLRTLVPESDERALRLILNGDIFDFLKMDYQGSYPRYITEEISLWKLEKVLESHPLIFKALRDFLAQPNASVHFVIGNHDFDLVWPALQARLRHVLAAPSRVFFSFAYEQGQLRAEHGNSLDYFFIFDQKRPIVEYKGQQILHLPLGSYVVFDYLAPFKRRYPREEQMYPREQVLNNHHAYRRELQKMIRHFLWKGLIVNPLLHLGDPTYKVPYGLLWEHFWRYGLNVFDDRRFFREGIKHMVKNFPGVKLFVFGHFHDLVDTVYRDVRFLVTDTWRDEFFFESGGMQKKDRSYAEVIMRGDEVESATLKVLDFDKGRVHGGLDTEKVQIQATPWQNTALNSEKAQK